MGDIRTIAFYLPQFYPTPENDRWWEPGFTEWTNVASAKPLFKGHYQPKLPRDLGFYDLRVPETRERQAELAREAGIEGFCYWHYWFGGGKRLLTEVFDAVLKSGKPDFPFCLCWANHSWYAKTWKPDAPNKLLVEQIYPGEEDYEAHFMAMLPAFKDKRYIKVNGKLLFGVFIGSNIPDCQLFFDTWNRLAAEHGLTGFHFFSLAQGQERIDKLKRLGFDRIVTDAYSDVIKEDPLIMRKLRRLLHRPTVVAYSHYARKALEFFKRNNTCTPCIDPNFDHTPRSGFRGHLLQGSTPKKWGKLCRMTKDYILHSDNIDNLLFIKSWNEWGEGNYLEPDRRWGKAYIRETAKALAAGNVTDK